MNVLKVFSVQLRGAYEIRDELWAAPCKSDEPVRLLAAYSCYDGGYIGTEKEAILLCKKRGIIPQRAKGEDCICTIGFSPKERKWFGWSHRAIFGFSPGMRLLKGDVGGEYTPKGKCLRIKTWADARLAAEFFARSVS